MAQYNLTAFGGTGLGYGRDVGYNFTADGNNTAQVTTQDDDAILNDWTTGNYHGTHTAGMYNGDTSSIAVSSDISWLEDGEMITSGVWYELEYIDPDTGNVETVEAFLVWDDTDNNWGGYNNSYVFTTDPLIDGVTYTVTSVDNNAGVTWEAIACFTTGTMIETDSGLIPIENITVGDMIRTLDHGLQPVRWAGARTVAARGCFAPICIKKDALGNVRDLLVSPQHRLLLQDAMATLYFNESEVLVAANHLLNGKTVYQKRGATVTYHHLLFDRHEIIFSEGIPTESLHPNENSLRGVSSEARDEIITLFPQLENWPNGFCDTARPCLKKHEVVLLGADFK